jgi:putative nucleotidyltransferase with HDIG domain
MANALPFILASVGLTVALVVLINAVLTYTRSRPRPAPASRAASGTGARSTSSQGSRTVSRQRSRTASDQGAPSASRPSSSGAANRSADTARGSATRRGTSPEPPARVGIPGLDLTQLAPAPPEVRFRDPGSYNEQVVARVRDHVDESLSKMGPRVKVLSGAISSWNDPNELAELVNRDPVLAGRVLRTANSGFYGLRQPVASVSHAVLLLGHAEVRNLVMSACVTGAMGLEKVSASFLHGLWTHSFTVSRIAYALAKRLSIPRADEISTAALLHDIGKFLFLSLAPEKTVETYRPIRFSDAGIVAIEETVFGISHGAGGGMVAAGFGLPERASEGIARHHAPAASVPVKGSEAEKIAAVLYLADILVHLTAHRAPDEEPRSTIYAPRPEWLTLLGLDSIEATVDEGVAKVLRGSWQKAA